MVYSKVTFLKDRGQLKLTRSHLIVTCLARNTQFECLYLKILHESLYTFRNSTEVMVVHLLVLCRVMPHQRTACKHKVRTSKVQVFIYKEVFLFPSKVSVNLLYVLIKVLANLSCCNINSME